MSDAEPRPPAPAPMLPAVQLLRGRNFGLVSQQQDSDEARLFECAARALGAHVAHIDPEVAGLLGVDDLTLTARWLGRLYDAIECQGLPAERVEQIRASAGIPVFHHLAASSTSDQPGGAALQRLQSVLLGLFR